jgi:acetyl-CoA/propionyl-CoA carboxylase carboxyl transferase subunit
MSVLATAAPPDSRDPLLRLAELFDGADYESLDLGDDAEVRTAAGCINGARVIAYCTDATKMGGALGTAGTHRIIEAIEIAVRERRPVVGVWHSGGAKLADGVESMDAVGRVFTAMIRASGRVPQISVVVGPAAGAAAYGPALTDVIIMAPGGRVFITGPDVVRSVTGEQIDMEGLGGPETHSRRSGVAHVTAESEADAYRPAGSSPSSAVRVSWTWTGSATSRTCGCCCLSRFAGPTTCGRWCGRSSTRGTTAGRTEDSMSCRRDGRRT